jgi:alginate O-acetyltransferase complex protein AlgI
MVFASLLFIAIFLPAVLILYFVAPRKLRNLVLFLTSLVFYAWGEPVYIVLMLFSTLVDYTHGMLVHYFKTRNRMFAAKCVVFSAMTMNLLLLSFFKYADFFVNTVNSIFGLHIPMLNLPLPIGISFYTFQTMSYTIDVYRGDAAVQRNIISFGTYVTMFPQLIAGPIVRYKTIQEQIDVR